MRVQVVAAILILLGQSSVRHSLSPVPLSLGSLPRDLRPGMQELPPCFPGDRGRRPFARRIATAGQSCSFLGNRRYKECITPCCDEEKVANAIPTAASQRIAPAGILWRGPGRENGNPRTWTQMGSRGEADRCAGVQQCVVGRESVSTASSTDVRGWGRVRSKGLPGITRDRHATGDRVAASVRR